MKRPLVDVLVERRLHLLVAGSGDPFFWRRIASLHRFVDVGGRGRGQLARGTSVCVEVGWMASSGSRLTDFSLGHRGLSLMNYNYDSHLRSIVGFVGCLKQLIVWS